MKRISLTKNRISLYVIYIIFVFLIVFFTILLGNRFFSYFNFINILRQTAMISIMSIGMTFALSSGEIDLSVGSTISFSALLTAMTLRYYPTFVGVIVGLGSGILVGFLNGSLVAWLKIPSFLVTVGSMSLIGGLSRWVTGMKSIEITNERYNFLFGSGDIGNISILFIWTIGVMIIGFLLLQRTAYGRMVLASGGNEKAAFYTGINTRLIKMSTLMISAVSASLAGMLYAGRLHGVRYTIGEGLELSVIAATVIGGTSLFGGRGTIIGSVIGSLVIGIINNGLILLGLSIAEQMFFRGLILIVAVAINTRLQSR